MTAAELYELVKDVPEGAKPENLRYIEGKWWMYGPPSGEYVTPSLAEDALVGRMTRWLVSKETTDTVAVVQAPPTNELDGPFPSHAVHVTRFGMTYTSKERESLETVHEGISFIEALAAACKEIA